MESPASYEERLASLATLPQQQAMDALRQLLNSACGNEGDFTLS